MRYALLALLLMTGAAAAQGWPAVNSSIPAGRGTIGVQGYVANNTALKAAKGTDHTGGVHRQGFTTAGDGGAATYYWSASNCTAANDGTQVQPSVTGCWIAALGPEVDPVVFGADPTGIADSAPAIRAAIAASAHVKFSPGLYNLCSTQPSPYPNAINPTPILVQNKSNFVIDLGQARLKVCDAVVKPSNGTQTMTFDQVSNYSVIGGNFIGNQPTSSAVGLTGGICTMNAFGAKYLNQVFSGDWSSTSGGSAYCGDYIVDSVFSGAVTLDPVTAGFDFAFLQNVKIVDFNLRGKFGTGPGNSGVSVIYDGPMIGENKTGYTITDSTNVTIDGTATGFNAGWFIAAGSGYTIRGNYSGNVGTATQPAYGGIIGYNASGGASSVGAPADQFEYRRAVQRQR